MNSIQYQTTLKACGNEYKKIVFWNRFIRNPIETILTITPAIISIILICCSFTNTFLWIVYALFFAYPVYIFVFQFNSSVNYHLKNRDVSESAPCTITLDTSVILASIPDKNLEYTYKWDDFTTIYRKFGYYMFFEKSKMTLMLRINDMNDSQRDDVDNLIKKCVNMNICRILF